MPSPGRWMATAKLRALFRAGVEYEDIAGINEKNTGWRPHKSVVSRKRDAMGEPPRRLRHDDLIPWRIRPEHNNAEMRHMLQAESRRRAGQPQSDKDKILTSLLYNRLFDRGRQMVVGYHPDLGFYTIDRADDDTDIIRRPPDRISVGDEEASAWRDRTPRKSPQGSRPSEGEQPPEPEAAR